MYYTRSNMHIHTIIAITDKCRMCTVYTVYTADADADDGEQ